MMDLRKLRGIAKAKLDLGCHDDFHSVGSKFTEAFRAQVVIDLIDEIERLRRKVWEPGCGHHTMVHACADCEAYDEMTRHESVTEQNERLKKEISELRGT